MEEKLKLLIEQLKNFNPIFKDFNEYYLKLNRKFEEFQRLLEYAVELKKDEKEFLELYRRVSDRNSSNFVDELTRKGYELKNKFGEDFNKSGYRLLELTRIGERDEVYYSILKIFVANNKKFLDKLIEAFKPIYTEEMFKVFLFLFLSGIIGKDRKSENNSGD